MTQNRYIFFPPNSLDSPTQDTSIPNTAKSTSILNCKRVSDCEELVGVITGDDVAEMIISNFRSRKSISGPEMDVLYAVSIAVKSCIVTNGEIIHSSKSKGSSVFGIIFK